MVTWRETSVDDPRAHALLVDYFADRARGFPGGPGAYRTTFPTPQQFVPPNGVFLVAEDEVAEDEGARGEGADIGCGGIRGIAPDPLTSAVRFEVKHLYLVSATRGRGYGRLMLAELERRARCFGAAQLVLDTNASLAAAAGLYRSSGFVDAVPYNDNPNATNWYRKDLD